MRLELKEFQSEAVDALWDRLQIAKVGSDRGILQALSLSAPTGSGKTVILTALIERIFQGTESVPGEDHAIVLWMTDQPELNEQTRRKMLATSTELDAHQLVTIDTSFDKPELTPGKVYFLNTQKLGRNSNLVGSGDRRTWSLWQTLSSTLERYPRSFYVMIDEAHRGMTESRAEREAANTIMQKFIKGSSGEIPRVPLVIGISATPERFNELVLGTSRSSQSVDIHAEDVRDSGLLKEAIRIFHPGHDTQADITLLENAAVHLRQFEQQWEAYCQSTGDPPVCPLLIVQVEDRVAGSPSVTRTNLEEALTVLERVLGPLSDESVAHCFQEEASINFGGHRIRYCRPSDIEAEHPLRVVFFKTSLNTGWDCPRAEVMMSFRRANDFTLIAQLVGRMVRTPLARRVDNIDFLNTVSLYLPHFDPAGVQSVLERLGNPEIAGPVRIEQGKDLTTIRRDDSLRHCFEAVALAGVPTYEIPRTRKSTEVRRLLRMSRLIANDGFDAEAVTQSRDMIIDVLRSVLSNGSRTEHFQRLLADASAIDIREVKAGPFGDALAESRSSIPLSVENVNDLFQSAARLISPEVAHAYWRTRAGEDTTTLKTRAKLEFFALATDVQCRSELEAAAAVRLEQLLTAHMHKVTTLPPGRREAYSEIRRAGEAPSSWSLVLPDSIDVLNKGIQWPKHLFSTDGIFPFDANRWEQNILEEELSRLDVIGWLRNPDRKHWSLAVPYWFGGECRPFYPDFLFVP